MTLPTNSKLNEVIAFEKNHFIINSIKNVKTIFFHNFWLKTFNILLTLLLKLK